MSDFKKAMEVSTEEAKQFILGQKNGRVFHVIFNRPERSNAFTFGMYVRMHLLFEQAGKDPEVDVVVLSANGKNFSAGNDLNNFNMVDFGKRENVIDFADTQTDILKVFTANLLNFVKPVICCCQGATVGFVFPLISIFDLIYVTEDAFFSGPMIKMEQSLEMFGSYTFPRLFGTGKAFELQVLGRKLNAKEAIQLGFAQQIFKTHEDMMKYANLIATELTQMNQSSVREAKKLMKDQVRKSLWAANLAELNNLNKVWKDPQFTAKLQKYMKSISLKPKL